MKLNLDVDKNVPYIYGEVISDRTRPLELRKLNGTFMNKVFLFKITLIPCI